MQNDIENYLTTQKQKLENDKARLIVINNSSDDNEDEKFKENKEIVTVEIHQNYNDDIKSEDSVEYSKSDKEKRKELSQKISSVVDPYKFYENVIKNQSLQQETDKESLILTKADKDTANENKLDKQSKLNNKNRVSKFCNFKSIPHFSYYKVISYVQ